MTVEPIRLFSDRPLTLALQRVLYDEDNRRTAEDLLFLERWEIHPVPGPAAALRVSQIRRANPELAAAIRNELTASRRNKETNLGSENSNLAVACHPNPIIHGTSPVLSGNTKEPGIRRPT